MLGMVEKIQRKKYKPHRSYGFICAYDGERYWFNLKGNEDLQVGDEVSFSGGRNEKGFVARYVKKITEQDGSTYY